MALTAYQKHVKREMKKGKSMKQAAKSWRKKKSTKSRTRNSSSTTSGRSRSGMNTNKIYGLIRKAALLAPAAGVALDPKYDSAEKKIKHAMRKYTGFLWDTGEFRWEWLAEGWMPYLGAKIGTEVIPRVGHMIKNLLG